MSYRMELGYALRFVRGEGWVDVILSSADVEKAKFIGFRTIHDANMGVFKVGRIMVAQLRQNLTWVGAPRAVGRRRTKKPARKKAPVSRRKLAHGGARKVTRKSCRCGKHPKGHRRRVGEDVRTDEQRELRDAFRDRTPREEQPRAPERRFTVTRVRLDSGGYDSGGRYYGRGAPLFSVEDHYDGRTMQLRAKDKTAAKAKIRTAYPGATFSR